MNESMKKMLMAMLCMVLMTLVLPSIVSAGPVPDTGQTSCYDDSAEIPCPQPGEPFYGQDAQYGTNLQSYTKLGHGGVELPDCAMDWMMVLDNVTGLMWEVKTDDGSWSDKDRIYFWVYVDQHIERLNNENFGGFSDWRFPDVKEFLSIMDNSVSNPIIDTAYFPNTQPDLYWTSVFASYYSGHPWHVDFTDGRLYTQAPLQGARYYVRAVRGEQVAQNLVNNGDGTVTDTSTGLMWQQATAPGTYTWQQALAYCENLILADYDDWRLPNRNELQSLVDYERYAPAVDRAFFRETAPDDYFTSTTNPDEPNRAREVNFQYGPMSTGLSKSNSYYVRAVRGGACGAFGDWDGDSICDDGDMSGVVGDNPCTGGETLLCDDNCAEVPNIDQADADNNGTGDACAMVIEGLLPDNLVVQQGGVLGYWIKASHNTASEQCFDYWTNVTLPSGAIYPSSGELLGPFNICLGCYETAKAHLTHLVPANTPLGGYFYNVYFGLYPMVWAQERFPFVVIAGSQANGSEEWVTTVDTDFSENILSTKRCTDEKVQHIR
jgi:hypothetical protein